MKINKEDLFRDQPITKAEFKKVARFLDTTYPAKTKNDIPFLAEEETFNVWYDLLKGYLYLPMCVGMKEYCLSNKYPPAVSDIAEYTDNMTTKLMETRRILKYNLEQISYECCLPEYTEEDIEKYYELMLCDDTTFQEIIKKSQSFKSYCSWEVNQHNAKVTSIQELIDLWSDYLTKRKKP